MNDTKMDFLSYLQKDGRFYVETRKLKVFLEAFEDCDGSLLPIDTLLYFLAFNVKMQEKEDQSKEAKTYD